MLKPLEQCQRCTRFKTQFRDLRASHPNYWNKPVPCSGSSDAPLTIIGLAPGMHGANRTGVPFTGDASGNLLFATLEKLSLIDSVMITNAVKCLPISNKPNAREIDNCQAYLRRELLPRAGSKVILALGRIAQAGTAEVNSFWNKQVRCLWWSNKFSNENGLVDKAHKNTDHAFEQPATDFEGGLRASIRDRKMDRYQPGSKS